MKIRADIPFPMYIPIRHDDNLNDTKAARERESLLMQKVSTNYELDGLNIINRSCPGSILSD